MPLRALVLATVTLAGLGCAGPSARFRGTLRSPAHAIPREEVVVYTLRPARRDIRWILGIEAGAGAWGASLPDLIEMVRGRAAEAGCPYVLIDQGFCTETPHYHQVFAHSDAIVEALCGVPLRGVP